MDLDEALDRLYAVPLDAFTRTRNELATELGSEGQEIKALRKPNLAAWALNQLAREHAGKVGELFDATEGLRRAQRRVLSGGKGSVLREATGERARVVNELTGLAAAILQGAGHSAAPATLAAISSSLVAVAADEEGTELLRKGRLSRELRAETVVSVEHGAGLTLVEDEEVDAAEGDGAGQEEARRAARAAVNEATEAAQRARKAARAAEAEAAERVREADAAERAVKAAREAAEFARRGAEARRAEAEEAAAALEAARKRLDELGGD